MNRSIVKFKIEIKNIKDIPIECVTKLTLEDAAKDQIIYVFPPSLQLLTLHHALLTKSAVKAAIKSLDKKVNHYRTVKIEFDEEIRNGYFDESGNAIFNEFLLEEEFEECESRHVSDGMTEQSSILTLASVLQEKLNIERKFNIKDAELLFNLNKFDGKMNVTDFLTNFESECFKHDVNQEQRIEILRFFLKDSALNWYDSQIKKLPKDDWSTWKTSLKKVFGIQNFAAVRSALDFKYISGRILDYALKKENLLLDLDNDMNEKTRIDFIVVGLPISIQNKLQRGKLSDVDELCKQLSVLDPRDEDFQTYSEKPISPCSICANMNKPNRFHLEEVCRFKDMEIWNDEKVNNVNLQEERKVCEELFPEISNN